MPATEKQISYINSLLVKLNNVPARGNRFASVESMKSMAAKMSAEIEAVLPTMTKTQASNYIGDLISMTR